MDNHHLNVPGRQPGWRGAGPQLVLDRGGRSTTIPDFIAIYTSHCIHYAFIIPCFIPESHNLFAVI